jgi:eukaryotic-like serine/threonine-protein kinase
VAQELLEHIGTGGMAEVYRARQLNAFGREVAVKIIKRGFAEQPLFRQRFLREGQATARLAHPHILPLIELGTAGRRGQTLFLAMPYVREGTLRDLLARTGGPLPIETIAPLFIQLCEAVQYAHEQGLVHRDIKPSNVLLQHERYVLLGDFGIALDTEDMRLTSTGMGLGTPEYTAPEQAQGNVDKRSDIYSLGIVLFELLTGQVPFTGRTPFEVLFKQTTATIPSLRSADSDLPEKLTRLDAVIQGTLAKEPARRFQTASALGDAFQAALVGGAQAANTPEALPVAANNFIPTKIADRNPTPAFDDPLGERLTSPASLPARFPRYPARYAQIEQPAPSRSKVPLIALSVLGLLLLGGLTLVIAAFLLFDLGSNSLNAPTPTTIPSPQSTPSPSPTQSPQRSPTSMPTRAPTPTPTPRPTPSPTPTPPPPPTPTPTP